MDTQSKDENPNQPRLSLQRIYLKNNSFETFSVNMASFQNPVQAILEMQVFANAYAQENNVHQAVLGLKIDAKHQGDLVWRLQMEMAGFYTLERFSEDQQKGILHGYCMNQLYNHASVIATQIVTQGGFLPIYLQPMDFNRMYQEQKKEVVSQAEPEPSEVFAKRLNAVSEMHDAELLLN
jgi:preprotein translocase subunit SecB